MDSNNNYFSARPWLLRRGCCSGSTLLDCLLGLQQPAAEPVVGGTLSAWLETVQKRQTALDFKPLHDAGRIPDKSLAR
ncbi:MAG TPA: hypothetical protein VFK88_09345 [Gallionella sp.]|nr:hypothetical protein [Gallionella sp.]